MKDLIKKHFGAIIGAIAVIIASSPYYIPYIIDFLNDKPAFKVGFFAHPPEKCNKS